jgi:hypothetical protein
MPRRKPNESKKSYDKRMAAYTKANPDVVKAFNKANPDYDGTPSLGELKAFERRQGFSDEQMAQHEFNRLANRTGNINDWLGVNMGPGPSPEGRMAETVEAMRALLEQYPELAIGANPMGGQLPHWDSEAMDIPSGLMDYLLGAGPSPWGDTVDPFGPPAPPPSASDEITPPRGPGGYIPTPADPPPTGYTPPPSLGSGQTYTPRPPLPPSPPMQMPAGMTLSKGMKPQPPAPGGTMPGPYQAPRRSPAQLAPDNRMPYSGMTATQTVGRRLWNPRRRTY